MRAIDRLEKSGLTTAQIAAAAHTSTQAIRHYVHMRRFPNKHVFTALVHLAESRGVLLLASDFINDGSPFASQRDVA
jgi:hypothetical protein